MKKALFVATVDIHIKAFHLPYLKLLCDNGYDVHVATNGDEKFDNCKKKYKISIERNPFKVNNIKAIIQLKKIIEDEKYDLIHCHTPMGAVVTRLASKRARRKFGTKVFYTAHGFHFYKGAPLINWLLFYPIEWYLSKFTDTIITINKEDNELAKKKFIKRCKNIKYVPGVGIDTKKFDISMSNSDIIKTKQKLGIKKDDKILICVARLDKNKNQKFLIDCMDKLVKKYKNLHLLLVGRDELNDYYQSITKEKKLESYVHFLGNRDDVANLLYVSDIIVSSSKREGLPVNVIEAFSVGKAVVALDCRGMKDLVTESNGFVIKNDENVIDNFCEKIELILSDEKLKESIEINNKESSKKYDVKNILKLYDNIYDLKKES